ncbi:MAG: protein kinase [Alphaproteobacteria bacterium]|nr:protein kinase [Alphaproteobacteria bacterium]
MDALPTFQPGDIVLGRYRVEALLGVGGSASVSRATDLRGGPPVALKHFHQAIDPSASVVRERAALALLTEPGVVQLLGSGAHAGRPVLVLELVTGQSFPPHRDWDALRPLVVDLLQTLGATHQRGIVHRDLKPANVYVVRGRGVVILDFGLARGTSLGQTLTATGDLVGTPRYMAPEQLTGQSVGPAADLYAVGVMVYEALTGHVPHAADTAALLWSRRISEPAAPLATLRGDLDPGICTWVDWLLARRIDDRPTSAWAALDALRTGPIRVPRLDDGVLDDLEARVLRGGHVRLGGPRGSGRSTLLAALEERSRLPMCFLRPADEPFGSLGFLGIPDAVDDPESWIHDHLDPATVVVADPWDAVDPWTRALLEAGPWSRITVGPDGDIATRAFDASELEALFTGSERIGRERSDAARELHRRTGGIARGIVETLGRWRLTGVAQPDGDRFHVPRGALDRLASQSAEPWRSGGDAAAPAVREHLRWTAFVGPAGTSAVVARVRGTPRWREERLRRAAEADGWVRDDVVFADLDPLPSAPEAHARCVEVLAPGTPGRLAHALLASDRDALGLELGIELARGVQSGRTGPALATVLRAQRALPTPLDEDAAADVAEIALSLRTAPSLADAREVLALCGRRDSPVDRLLAFRQTPDDGAPEPMADTRLEVLRIGVCVECHIDGARELVDGARAWRLPDRQRAQVLEWSGLLALWDGDPRQAVAYHDDALVLRDRPSARFSSLANLTEALIWAGRLEEAEARGRQALALADELRHVRHTARAERLLRTCALRQGSTEPDLALADALPLDAEVQLTEAMIAARSRDPRAAEHARRALEAGLPNWAEPVADAIRVYVGERTPFDADGLDPRVERDVRALLAGLPFDGTGAPYTGALV